MKNTALPLLIAFFLFLNVDVRAQEKQYKVGIIGVYNRENMIDTINQPDVNDEEVTKKRSNLYTSQLSCDTLGKIDDVLSKTGSEMR